MPVDLVKKLLMEPQRENAGARAANRFTFQQVWAFNYMLEVMDSGMDFILFMEFHDDVIVLDKTSNNQVVEFYQIKTDAKDSRYITTSFITKNAKKYPEKMSIAQKMIDEYVKFKNDTKGLHLVSNKNFDFGVLKDSTESKYRSRVVLSELNDEELKKIKNGMCQACDKKENCTSDCLNLIYFDVSDLNLVSYESTVMGNMLKKLNTLGISATSESIQSMYNAILGQIKTINNDERISQNVDELLKRKSISKDEFCDWINRLKKELPDALWDNVQAYLLNDGFPTLTVNKIHKQWKKYEIERMDIEALGLQKLAEEVIHISENSEIENCKDLIEFVYEKIKDMPEAMVQEKYYLYALIARELFS